MNKDIIIIEGPDGAGKSTLVNYLVSKGYTSIHSSSQTENTLDYHIKLLDNNKVVLDRANLGEIVYPAIYGRTPKMSIYEQHEFMDKCEKNNIMYIVFFASDFNTLKERLFSRGDTQQVLENAEKINLAFKLLALEYSERYKNVIPLDISKVDDQILFYENNSKKED
jgi:thymidylate kinase